MNAIINWYDNVQFVNNLKFTHFRSGQVHCSSPPGGGWGGGGGGGTLIFSHILRLRLFFGVQNSELQYFLGFFFEKNEYFLGCVKILWIFFFWGGGVITKLGLFEGHFYAFQGLFLRSRYRIGIFFGVAKISNIFLGCLKFLIFFWGER